MKMKKIVFGDNATRQVNTANFLILYIFKQSLTYVHKRIYEHINYSLVISWASCVSPQPLLFTCNEPLFLITRAGALRKVDAMVVFTSLSEHLCDFITAAEKKISYLVSLCCCWYTCDSAVTELYDLKGTRLGINRFHAKSWGWAPINTIQFLKNFSAKPYIHNIDRKIYKLG